jgi:PhnB protein
MPESIPLNVTDADLAVAFYRDVFDATELQRESLMDGRILTADLLIGCHCLLVSEWEDTPATPDTVAGLKADAAVLTFECAGAGAVLKRALAAGARIEPPADGGRPGVLLRDPSGQRWRLVDRP